MYVYKMNIELLAYHSLLDSIFPPNFKSPRHFLSIPRVIDICLRKRGQREREKDRERLGEDEVLNIPL